MRALSVTLILLAGPIMAQDLAKTMELPAHNALMALRDKAGLSKFESDGCSGGLSTTWRLVSDTFPEFAAAHEASPPWEECCVIHDRAYHEAAGAASADESYDARIVADWALRACVMEKGELRAEDLAERYEVTPDQVRAAYETIAGAMYLAVRFGGGPCTGLPWRWGFGYPGCTPFDTMVPARE
ncbi:MAG: hypothetical protein AB3N22_11155 [Ruegeria sp.]